MATSINSNDIMKTVDEIRTALHLLKFSSEGQKIAYFKSRHEEFFSKFPKLFLALLNEEFDVKFLKLLLNQRDFAAQSQENFQAASSNVHETLNELYIYPKISKEDLQKMVQEKLNDNNENVNNK